MPGVIDRPDYKLDIQLSVWRIHRRIGMSGGLFVAALLRETGRSLSDEDIEDLQRDHAAEYLAQIDSLSLAQLSLDQPTCRCTFSVLEGPGSADAIHGPGIDGSMMPCSSQV